MGKREQRELCKSMLNLPFKEVTQWEAGFIHGVLGIGGPPQFWEKLQAKVQSRKAA